MTTRNRPLVHLSLSPDAIARLQEIATRCGESRSAVVERLVRDADGLAEELKARAKFRMALEVIRDMLGPNGREAFVMQGPRMFWVLRVVEDALK